MGVQSLDDVTVGIVPPADLAKAWPIVSSWIGAALDKAPNGSMSLKACRRRVRDGRYALVIAAQGQRLVGAMILEAGKPKDETILAVIAAGGARGVALEVVGAHLWTAVQNIGRGLGARVIRITGRPGWLRWVTPVRSGSRRIVRQIMFDFQLE